MLALWGWLLLSPGSGLEDHLEAMDVTPSFAKAEGAAEGLRLTSPLRKHNFLPFIMSPASPGCDLCCLPLGSTRLSPTSLPIYFLQARLRSDSNSHCLMKASHGGNLLVRSLSYAKLPDLQTLSIKHVTGPGTRPGCLQPDEENAQGT